MKLESQRYDNDYTQYENIVKNRTSKKDKIYPQQSVSPDINFDRIKSS